MNKALFFVLVALVGAAVIGGLMVAGGPGYARLEKDDVKRAQDLQDWGRYYGCHADGEDVMRDGCDGQSHPPTSTDPETGTPYRYARLDENALEVCATFRTRQSASETNYTFQHLTFLGEEGCLRYKRADPESDWVRQ